MTGELLRTRTAVRSLTGADERGSWPSTVGEPEIPRGLAVPEVPVQFPSYPVFDRDGDVYVEGSKPHEEVVIDA